MFELSDAAKKQLDMYFANHEVSPIRVYMANGCGGPRLALGLDEENENDEVYEVEGFKFLVDKSLMKIAAPIKVDFNEMGFFITSSMKLSPGGCSSCSSCG